MRALLTLSACLCLLSVSPPLRAQSAAASASDLPLRQVLVIPSAGRATRSAVHTDALEARIVSGQWHAPVAGETLRSATGSELTWSAAEAAQDGSLDRSVIRGGYVYWPVPSSGEQVMVLEAAGHNLAYVNGAPRAGDPYSYGYVRLPVLLRPGTNDLLFQCSRGGLRAKLTRPAAPVLVDPADTTLPDIISGEFDPVWGAVVLLNATTNFTTVALRTHGRKPAEQSTTIPPLSVRKAPFQFYPPRDLKAGSNCPVALELTYGQGRNKSHLQTQLSLRVRRPDQTHKRTFISSIDGSVQYYAVNPASGPIDGSATALFLSLHGASVEALGQAEAYSPKRWGHIVCPTNRRPYGFDWEEWGRWDALEVLALAEARYHPDLSRVYLTGHSMGGHGTWQLGALLPDRFAAIGPSAGWISFTSYAETNRFPATNQVQQLLRRSAAASDTLLMATNYLQEGIYVLHGDADDNVPVTEARTMRRVLGEFHRDFDYYEQPAAGHWWDASDEPGADCVDWAPMFDFFAHHVIASDASVRRVRFVTVNPAVSARSHWVTVLAQEHSLEPSAVDVRCDPGKRRLVGTTTNVARLGFAFPAFTPGLPVTIELDNQKFEGIPLPNPTASSSNPEHQTLGHSVRRRVSLAPWLQPGVPATESGSAVSTASRPSSQPPVLRSSPAICLVRENGQWRLSEAPPSAWKNPARSGPFRQAFCNRMVFVYGTAGSAEETAQTLAKARYDAETFWYRGNGSVDILSDTEFLKLPEAEAGSQQGRRSGARSRNVILYGNADNNAAWPRLLGDSPIQVHRGSVRAGQRELTGDDLACLFLRPHPTDPKVLVGIVSGSGLPGLRLAERMPYFLSGAGFPDCLIVGADMLTNGINGVRVVGFFGNDWSMDTGEFGWNAPPAPR